MATPMSPLLTGCLERCSMNQAIYRDPPEHTGQTLPRTPYRSSLLVPQWGHSTTVISIIYLFNSLSSFSVKSMHHYVTFLPYIFCGFFVPLLSFPMCLPESRRVDICQNIHYRHFRDSDPCPRLDYSLIWHNYNSDGQTM